MNVQEFRERLNREAAMKYRPDMVTANYHSKKLIEKLQQLRQQSIQSNQPQR